MLWVIVDFRCMKIGLWNYRFNCMLKCFNYWEILLFFLLLCYYNVIGYVDNVLFLLDSLKDNIV